METRHTRPDIIRYIWAGIKKLHLEKKYATTKYLFRFIPSEMGITKEMIEESLNNAADEELLVEETIVIGKKKEKIYKVPNRENLIDDETTVEETSSTRDWYCYECHLPGTVIKCENCPRSFHLTCVTKPETQPDTPARPVENGGPNMTANDTVEIDVTGIQELNEITPPQLLSRNDSTSSTPETKFPVSLKNEDSNDAMLDMKPIECIYDVEFVQVLRQPNKRYEKRNQLIKNESTRISLDSMDRQSEGEDHSNITSLCRRCFVLKKAKLIVPPNMQKQELNYLLTFLFNRVRTWLPEGTYTPLHIGAQKVPFLGKAEFQLFRKKFFMFNLSMNDIRDKLQAEKYEMLDELYCDVLDIQHNVAILHGVSTEEYEATNYLKKDVLYEISEIYQCRDCYRHSNEMIDNLWFTKPCILRHELVFAKQTRFPYWPAKVLKVIDNQYDVRFFGGKHERALIDANNIKPIDTSLNELKINKLGGRFGKAMEELEIHQQKVALPVGTFSFVNEHLNGVTNGVICESIQPLVQYITPIVPVSETLASSNDLETEPTRKRRRSSRAAKAAAATKNNNNNNDVTVTPKVPVDRRKRRKINNDESQTVSTPTRPLAMVPPNINESTPTNSTQSSSIFNDIPPLLLPQDTPPQPRTKGRMIEKSRAFVVNSFRDKLNSFNVSEEATEFIINTFETEVSRWQMKLKNTDEEHKRIISEVKKKQWCMVCEKLGRLYCCWNVSYCTNECQQTHWAEIHKYECTRRNGTSNQTM